MRSVTSVANEKLERKGAEREEREENLGTAYLWTAFTLQHPLHVHELVLDVYLAGLQHLLVERIDRRTVPQVVPVLDKVERIAGVQGAQQLHLGSPGRRKRQRHEISGHCAVASVPSLP